MRAPIIMFFVAAAPVAASAQDLPAAAAAAAACRAIDEDGARLACFDVAAEGLAAALPASASPDAPAAVASPPAPPPADPSTPAATDLAEFGLTQPVIARNEGEFGAEAIPAPPRQEEEGLQEIRARVVNVERTGRGRLIFELDNAQVWRQIDGDTTSPRLPDTAEPFAVVIKRGWLGSYRLTIEGRRAAVRVRRTQ